MRATDVIHFPVDNIHSPFCAESVSRHVGPSHRTRSTATNSLSAAIMAFRGVHVQHKHLLWERGANPSEVIRTRR